MSVGLEKLWTALGRKGREGQKEIEQTNAKIFSFVSPRIESSKKFGLEKILEELKGKVTDFRFSLLVEILTREGDWLVELASSELVKRSFDFVEAARQREIPESFEEQAREPMRVYYSVTWLDVWSGSRYRVDVYLGKEGVLIGDKQEFVAYGQPDGPEILKEEIEEAMVRPSHILYDSRPERVSS